MKPWYWPVTTTVYKLILGFILVQGIDVTLEIFWRWSVGLRIFISYVITLGFYWSLWKRDWL